ncbi:MULTISPECIES: SDR family NAD(P)-dependent oxidoreductase [unclassified Streptomyces]|uniref:SDR family NAD(P)-dependent oxidoreductase n=1 Tax=unclassified Streptomyces TaxID=2593676 RepID=UPI00136A6037|nr:MULTISPECIES: SDR family oxidoreductase [unclassified Streptomyces]MCW5250422.1 SDR family oxidoreductase [Streptomyces sp. SHP 1-2]MYU25059.1 SDR family NAD(P)-dependent oxidoreductase [Streptomyces sp. SID8352]
MSVAVITGAASGLGRVLASAFAEAGHRVAGIDVRDEEPPDGVTAWKADLTDPAAVSTAFTEIRAALGAPTVCVTAAGIYPRSTLGDATAETYRAIFDVNVLGTLLAAQSFASVADPSARNTLVTVSSVDGITPLAKSVLYSASKAAVINLTAGIAGELAGRGIRVVGIAPGYIATDRVIELNGGRDNLPADASDPAEIARACVGLTRDGGIPLLTGQTVTLRRSALEAPSLAESE